MMTAYDIRNKSELYPQKRDQRTVHQPWQKPPGLMQKNLMKLAGYDHTKTWNHNPIQTNANNFNGNFNTNNNTTSNSNSNTFYNNTNNNNNNNNNSNGTNNNSNNNNLNNFNTNAIDRLLGDFALKLANYMKSGT